MLGSTLKPVVNIWCSLNIFKFIFVTLTTFRNPLIGNGFHVQGQYHFRPKIRYCCLQPNPKLPSQPGAQPDDYHCSPRQPREALREKGAFAPFPHSKGVRWSTYLWTSYLAGMEVYGHRVLQGWDPVANCHGPLPHSSPCPALEHPPAPPRKAATLVTCGLTTPGSLLKLSPGCAGWHCHGLPPAVEGLYGIMHNSCAGSTLVLSTWRPIGMGP